MPGLCQAAARVGGVSSGGARDRAALAPDHLWLWHLDACGRRPTRCLYVHVAALYMLS